MREGVSGPAVGDALVILGMLGVSLVAASLGPEVDLTRFLCGPGRQWQDRPAPLTPLHPHSSLPKMVRLGRYFAPSHPRASLGYHSHFQPPPLPALLLPAPVPSIPSQPQLVPQEKYRHLGSLVEEQI